MGLWLNTRYRSGASIREAVPTLGVEALLQHLPLSILMDHWRIFESRLLVFLEFQQVPSFGSRAVDGAGRQFED